MKKPRFVRSIVIGACTVVATGAIASFALAAAPPIAPGAVTPAGTASWMVSPCTGCHTYTTPVPVVTPPTTPGGTVTTPVPPVTPVRTCGNCHKDPGVGVSPPAEDHPWLSSHSTSTGEHEKAESKKHAKKHVKKHAKKAKKRVVRKAKRVSRDD